MPNSLEILKCKTKIIERAMPWFNFSKYRVITLGSQMNSLVKRRNSTIYIKCMEESFTGFLVRIFLGLFRSILEVDIYRCAFALFSFWFQFYYMMIVSLLEPVSKEKVPAYKKN